MKDIFITATPGRGRRAAARGEGPLRHRRRAHDLRLGDLRRACARRQRRGRDAGWRARATRASARPTCTSSPTASRPTTRTTGACPTRSRADRIAGGSSGGCAAAIAAGLADAGLGHRLGRLDPDPVRLLRHRRLQADLRARAARRLLPAGAELRPRRPDGARRRGPASGCSRRSRRATSRSRSTTCATCASASPGRISPTRSCARACSPRPRVFPDVRALELPLSFGTGPLFGREAAIVHERLWREHRDAYSDNVARKIELAMAVTDAEVAEAERVRARVPRADGRADGRRRPRADADARDGRAARRARRRRRSAIASCSSPTRSTRSARRRSRCRAAPPRTGCRRPSSSSAAPATTRSCSPPGACWRLRSDLADGARALADVLRGRADQPRLALLLEDVRDPAGHARAGEHAA